MEQAASPKVVLRYRDGRTLRCTLQEEFSAKDFEFQVSDENADVHTIDVTDLKAVFFVKDSKERSADFVVDEDKKLPGGAMARVEFFDGEIIRGRVSQYSVSDAGFYLVPTATESNNRRIFVVATSLATVSIEG